MNRPPAHPPSAPSNFSRPDLPPPFTLENDLPPPRPSRLAARPAVAPITTAALPRSLTQQRLLANEDFDCEAQPADAELGSLRHAPLLTSSFADEDSQRGPTLMAEKPPATSGSLPSLKSTESPLGRSPSFDQEATASTAGSLPVRAAMPGGRGLLSASSSVVSSSAALLAWQCPSCGSRSARPATSCAVEGLPAGGDAPGGATVRLLYDRPNDVLDTISIPIQSEKSILLVGPSKTVSITGADPSNRKATAAAKQSGWRNGLELGLTFVIVVSLWGIIDVFAEMLSFGRTYMQIVSYGAFTLTALTVILLCNRFGKMNMSVSGGLDRF